MATGYYLFRGDKSACGGVIIDGCSNHRHFNRDIARERDRVTCGVHEGIYLIAGGMRDKVHGRKVAGTLESFSTCPCRSHFVPSIWTDHYNFSGGTTVTHTDLSHLVDIPVLPGPVDAAKQNNLTETCKPEDNPLLNGVYLWTEATGSGHAFVSVHENNTVYLYTYGRYGRTDRSTLTGDGILNFFQGEDARKYYQYELYEMGARVFRIDDANPELIRKFFEELWNNGEPAIQTPKMEDGTKRRGRTIDKYDVTGNNCTTHSIAGIKFSGSKLFDNGYTTRTLLPIEVEEDFTIPISLQNYLDNKSSDVSSMLVIEVTNEFKSQYTNFENKSFQPMGGSAKIQKAATESSAVAGSVSPYSGGTVGGSLGSTHDE
ncbi:PAAR domain-containing protein [Buttiauxella sp. 3AFRM03]|uniref:PAAR domain-containing protein n=1 Tax=Buttiauxella sp. 3AFRM03 TaxID=2479367 RepID=UPI000EF7BD74|nr:PAAR domain-containing protein [Buttiauxella sp. 3AFRM03]AYN26395.1 PAAR domain-containing protein [Buttiauxella sp. 3AFRM03]